jgi:hypothetical protein
MSLILISLVGLIEIDDTVIQMAAVSVGVVLNKPLKVSDQVWIEIIKRKYSGRYRNADDVIRAAFGMPVIGKPVKHYSDEGEGIAVIEEH